MEGKVDIPDPLSKCPLMTQSGHWIGEFALASRGFIYEKFISLLVPLSRFFMAFHPLWGPDKRQLEKSP